MLSDKQNIDLKKFGIIKIENFLSITEVEELHSILKKYAVGKGDKKSYFSNNFSKIMIKLIKFDFTRFRDEIKILNFSKKLNLKNMADSYFDDRTYLKMVDGYYNPISNKPILPWHHDCWRDSSVHPDDYSLKFFIYLTNVGKNNGCMSYIKKSHLICDAIRRGIYERKLEFGPYREITDFRNYILNKKNFTTIKSLMDDPKIIDEFLDSTENLNDNLEHSMDYTAKPGDVIVFNEKGLHRGSSPKKNYRIVLRYHFRKKNLV